MMEQKHKLAIALGRMMNRKLAMGWLRWVEWYETLKGEQYRLAGAIRRMMNRQLSMAWEQWQVIILWTTTSTTSTTPFASAISVS